MRPAVVIVLLLVVGWSVYSRGDDARPDHIKAFMRSKLTHTQDLLEALVLEDYPGIAKQAESLKLISFDSSWQVVETQDYMWQSQEFRRTMEGLVKAAENKNLDGAVLAHLRMTQSCVGCHRIMHGLNGR